MKVHSAFVVILFSLYLKVHCQVLNFDAKSPIVSSKLGSLEGTWRTSKDGRKFAAFEGIPFAKPPLESLRFKEPQPVEPWSGIWKATRTYKCIQPLADIFGKAITTVTGDEDCLYLNVYVPEVRKNEKLDVFVHIHGGAFTTGFPNEFVNPDYVMDRDWIYVGINYRLGALGFLSTEDDVVPGNNGLKDQVLALKWIQDNIEYFGGNRNSVTITGFSAGAASVQFHYFSPLSKGLFHKGISHSGSAIAPWAIADNPLQNTRKLAAALGCDTDDNRILVECLKQRPADLITYTSFEIFTELPPLIPFCYFAPVIEKASKTAFLTEYPYEKLRKGDVLDLPWIASHTPEEGLIFLPYKDKLQDMLQNNFSLVKFFLHTHESIPTGQENEILTKIKKYYQFDNGLSDGHLLDHLVKATTDRLIKVYSMQAAEMQSQVTKSPIYYYVFPYYGTNNFKSIFTNDGVKGTSHGDDMIYFYGGSIFKPLTEKDNAMKNTCMDLTHSYAKNGKPTNGNIKWEPVSNKFVYLNFIDSEEIVMETQSEFPEREFWTGLGLLENENLYVSKDEL